VAVRTYDPKAVSISANGIPIGGFADGTFVEIERSEDMFTKVVGADGETSRSKTNDRSGMITITLAQTSLSNDILSGLAYLDEVSNTGVFPVLVKDNEGNAIFFSEQAWIKKVAPASFSKGIENREWVIECADLDPFPGGTSPFGG